MATIARAEIKRYTEEDHNSTKIESQDSEERLSLYYENSNKDFYPKDLIVEPSSTSKNKIIRMGGLTVEGARLNLVPNNWFQEQNYTSLGSEIKNLRILSTSPEYIFRIKPQGIFNIIIDVPPFGTRNDYTFSFLYYTTGNNFPHVKLTSTISAGNEKIEKPFLYKDYDIFLKKEGTIVFRPTISHKFSSQPQKIIAGINLENTTTNDFIFILCFPQLEPGLFASSPILPSTMRREELYQWEGADKIFSQKKGTLSFFFQPFWGANELTIGISPHLFYWVSNDKKNGIMIFADSNDNGKIKAEFISNGLKSYITSETFPLKGEVYSICLRWDNDIADLIINGKSTNSAKIVLPLNINLSSKFYLGGSPDSEEDAAFAVFRSFNFYSEWLSDRIIKSEIYRSLPTIFPEFEGYAKELLIAK